MLMILTVFVVVTFFTDPMHKPTTATFPDGRQVSCVKTHAGGISCDWQGAK
jgi:hypothetical protein